jgi:hypothetical protein
LRRVAYDRIRKNMAVLAYFGEEMMDTGKNSKGDIEFIFNQSPNLQDLIKAYSMNELSVNPRQFSVALKDVKKIIYSQK